MRTPSSEGRGRRNIERQRFMRGKDTRKERKLETKQAEYSKGSHTPRIIMKFPDSLWLPWVPVLIYAARLLPTANRWV